MKSTDSTYAFLGLNVDQVFNFQDIANINFDYDSNMGGIGAGAPRFRIRLDLNNNGLNDVNDGSMTIHWGPAGSFVDTTIGNNLNTGNLVALTDLGRYDLSQIGGSAYTDRTAALTLAGSFRVWRIGVVIDSFGGNDRDFDINAMNVDLAPVPEPATYVAGALLLLPFGASALRRLRKRTDSQQS